MTTFISYIFIGCGGALGACLRYFLTQESTRIFGNSFPVGTLIVNVLGSFALGCMYAWLEQQQDLSDNLRLFVGVGLLGALTTFSTFSYDTFLLLQHSEYLKAVLNAAANLSLCLLGIWLAFLLVKG